MPSDPTLYLYTSLTAGSSHIITATSRIETILKANKIPFKAVDIATDEKARLIWQRRSKGKKIPGLVKFNDVIADFEQIEEWNEYGELEDEIEAVIDIFGDVPVSSTSAEAQAAAAERAKAQQSQSQGGSSQARTASETRHISISEPTGERKKTTTEAVDKPESTMNMAMRQAGAEAAAKAGLKKDAPATTAAAASAPAPAPAATTAAPAAAKPAAATPSEEEKKPAAVTSTPAAKKPVDVTPEPKSTDTPSTLPESQEPSTVTDAKTPTQLASEGAPKISLDKVKNPLAVDEDASTGQSTLAQTLDKTRKSSVPNTPSALSKSTSISESHTLTAPASTDDTATKPSSSPRLERPRTEHRGSSLDPASAEVIKEAEKRNSIQEVDEESTSEEEDSEEDDEEEEEEDVTKGKKTGSVATAVGATDKEEKKVTGGQKKTQEQGAKDVDKVGVSVGD